MHERLATSLKASSEQTELSYLLARAFYNPSQYKPTSPDSFTHMSFLIHSCQHNRDWDIHYIYRMWHTRYKIAADSVSGMSSDRDAMKN